MRADAVRRVWTIRAIPAALLVEVDLTDRILGVLTNV